MGARTDSLLDRVADLITRRPGAVLAGVAVVTVLAALPLTRARVDSSLEKVVPRDHPERRYLEEHARAFRIDEPMVVALPVEPTAFRRDFLERLDALTRRVETIPGVRSVRSLTNVQTVLGDEDVLTLAPVVPRGDEATPEALARAARRVAGDPLLADVVAADGRAVALVIALAAPAAGEPLEVLSIRTTAAVRAAVRDVFGPGQAAHLAGLPYLRGKLVSTIQHELRTIAVANGVVIAVLLLLVFRSLAGVVLPLLAMVVATTWVMGGMTLAGKEIDVYTGMVPSMILIIGVLDAIHIISEYQDEASRHDRRTAVRLTIRHLAGPCFLNSLTTGYGYASIMINPVPIIQDAGAVMAVGILVTFLVVITTVPALLCFWPPPALPAGWREESRIGRALAAVGDAVASHARLMLVVIAGLLVVIGFGISRLKVESEFVRYFKDRDPVARASRFLDARMGGSAGFDLVLDTGREGGVLDPAALVGIHRLAGTLRDDARVTLVLSPTDALAQLERALTGEARMPSSADEAAQLVLLLEGEGKALLEQVTAGNYARARLRVQTRSLPSRDFRALARRAEEEARRSLGPAVTSVRATGQHLMLLGTTDEIVDGQITTFLFDCLGLVLILAIAFRSLGLGLLSLVPNLLPILGGLAIMAATGISLNNVTAINACVGLGIAIDDTVHFLARFRRESATAEPRAALRATLLGVGRPMLLSTLVLSLGFATLMLSSFKNNSDTGAIASATLAIALLGDLLLLPVLLTLRRAPAAGRRGESGGARALPGARSR